MNGLEATQEILKLRPDQVIYALSANAFSEDIEAALAVGMKGFLTKPIQIPLLKEVLMQYSHAGTA
jgi:CheY-like chemotaxis protein